MSSFVTRSWLKNLCQKLLAKRSGRYHGSRIAAGRNPEKPKTHLHLESLETRVVPTVFTVTDLGTGAGSASDVTFAYALNTSQNGDTIAFASNLSGDTFTPSATENISKNITITGLGANNLAISGNNAFQVFNIAAGATVAISNLTIENGGANSGGGVANAGTLTLSNATVSNNSATVGAGIYNTGTLTVYDGTINGNQAKDNGGGIYNAGTMTVSNSTIYGNGYHTNGGGIANNGTLNVSNSTITGNTGYQGNSSYGFDGGGIQNSGQLTIVNSIVAGNNATETGPDIDGTVAVANNTVIESNSGFTITTGSGNQLGVNPQFSGGLAYNGGPTQTVALASTSPALFAGGPVTTVTAAVGLPDTTIQVGNAAAIASTPGDYTITIDNEEMLVTGVNLSTNTLTVQRDYNSTAAATHGVGADVYFSGDQRGVPSALPSIGAYGPELILVTDAGSGAGSATDVTLPYAVSEADSLNEVGSLSNASVIQFAPSLSGDTITLTSRLTLSNTISIEGLGSADLAVSGNHAVGVFSVSSGATVSISGLTIENASASSGAGVLNAGTLTLADDAITGNSARSGGGVFNTGTLTISDSSLTGNSAVQGGALFATGPVALSDIAISANTVSGSGSGIYTEGSGASLVISADTTTASIISNDIYCEGSPGLTLSGNGSISISGNIAMGSQGNLFNMGSGNVSIGGVISGPAVTAGAIASYAGLVLTNPSLTGYYPLNDPAGSTTVVDESSNDYAGTVDGSGTTFGVSGAYPQLGAAASFDGGSEIVLNSASSLGFNSSSWTALAWVYTGSTGVSFFGADQGGQNDAAFHLGTRSGQLWFGEYGDDSNSSVDLPLNQWNFVAYTFSGGTQSIYLNGTMVDQSTGHNQLDSAAQVEIGNSCCLGNLSGDIQQAAFFDSALSLQEIDALYAASDVGAANTVAQIGSGTLTLTNTNTYLGPTVISGGTLLVTNNSEMGPSNAAGIVIDGGTLALSGGFDYTDPESITISGTGVNGAGAIESISGDSTLSVSPTISGSASLGAAAGATLTVDASLTLPASTTLDASGAGTVDFADPLTVDAGTASLGEIGSGTLNVAGSISLPYQSVLSLTGSSNGTLDVTSTISLGSLGSLDVTSSGKVVISGVINGTPTSNATNDVTMDGSGTLDLTNANANTYTGSTTIDAGTVNVDSNSAFGPSTTADIIVDGGTLALSGGFDFTDPITISGTGYNGTGAIDNVSGNNTLGVSPTISGTASLGAAAGTTFTVDVPLTLPAGTTLEASGAGNVDIIDPLTVDAGTASLGETGSGTLDITSTISLGSLGSLDVTSSGKVVISGIINGTAASNGINDVTMDGSGTLDLTNSNTYTGYTTIDAGTVNVDSNSAFGLSSAAGIVIDGGTLALSGGFDFTDPITISGTGYDGTGAIDNVSGNNTLGVAAAISGATSFAAAAGTILTADMPLTLAAGSSLSAIGAGTVDLTETLTLGAGNVGLGENGSGVLNISGVINLPDATELNLTGSGTMNITNEVNLGAQSGLNNVSSGNVAITGVISGTSTSGISSGGFSSLILANPSLTGFYPLNDAAGSTTAADDSNNAYAGTVEGSGLAFGATGAYPTLGTAAGDSGSGYVNVNNAAALGLDSSNWTALAWVYVTGPDEAIIGMLNTGGGTNNDLQLIIRSDELYFGEYGDDSSTSTLIPENQWNFVAFTYSGGTQTIYMNGAEVNQSTGHSNLTTAETITLGGSDQANTLTGDMQDAAFFDSALSAQQISALYAAADVGIVYTVAQTGTGTMTLSGTNTYVGPTVISDGTLAVTNNSAMGPSNAAGITVSGGTLGLSGGFDYTDAEALTISSSGALESISGDNTFDVLSAFTGFVSVGAAAGATLTVEVPLTLSGSTALSGTPALTATGTGTVDLTKTVTLGAGIVALDENGSGTLNISGEINLPDATDLNLIGSGTMNITNEVNLGVQGSLNNSSAGNVTITGVISGSSTSGTTAVTFSSLVLSTPSLTGYYPLNDAPGSTTVADESSNDYTGTVAGSGTTFGVTGAYSALGTAASFDGNSDINIDNASNLGLDTSNWTAIVWVYTGSTGESFFGAANGSGTDSSLHLGTRSGQLWFGEYGDDSNSSVDMPLNQWNFVAFTFSSGTQSIYLNGTLVNQSLGHGQLTYTGTMLIGDSCCLGNNVGDLQQAAFFDSTLSAQQISALYAVANVSTAASTGYTVAQNGTGTMTLSGTNTYLGPTVISAGTLAVTNNSAMGSPNAAGITVSGGVLGLSGGFDYTDAELLTLTASGAIESLSGDNTLGVLPTISGNASFGALAGATLSVDVPLTLADGTSITSEGAGIVDLMEPITVGSGKASLGESGSGTLNVIGSISLPFQSVLDLTGSSSGTLDITSNISLGSFGSLNVSSSGNVIISGVISGTPSTGGQVPGLTGDYYDLTNASQSSIDPAASSNSAWLGNQTPATVATLVGPIDFQNIYGDGFEDVEGNEYYNPSPGNNQNLQARWSGEITIPSTSTSGVSFYDPSNIPSVVYINGVDVVDSFVGTDEVNTVTDLTPGATYSIDVEAYTTGSSNAEVELLWDPTGGYNFLDIPNSAFSTVESAAYNLTMSGSGSLVLSNTNTYTGSTAIEAGTVVVSGNSAFGPATAAGITVSGGTLGLSGGFNYTDAEPISISASGANGVGAVESVSGNNTFSITSAFSGSISLGAAAGATLNVNYPLTIPNGGYLTAGGAGTVDLPEDITVGSGFVNLGETGTGILNVSGTISLPDQTDLNLIGGSGGTLNIINSVYLESQASLDDASAGNVAITGVISGTAAAGTPAASYSSLVLANPSLTGYYPLNDAPGSTTVVDESSNDYAGTVDGSGTTFGVTGAYPALGTAASFDGGSEIVLNSASNLGFNSSSWTALAWVYTGSTGVSFFGADQGGQTDAAFHLGTRSGQLWFGEYGDDSNSSVDLPLNQWNFVAYTFSGGTQSIYLNGTMVDQSTGHNQLDSAAQVEIGNSCCLGNLSGDIQQAAFFDNALSLQEIDALYAASDVGLPNSLTVTGSGTLTLAPTNTYTGSTDIYDGTLVVTSNGAMGPSSAAGITVNGGTLGLSGGFTYNDAEPITISGTGAVESISGDNTFDLPSAFTGSVLVGAAGGATLNINFPLTIPASGTLAASGAGIVDLTGNITLGAGVVNLGENGTGTLNVSGTISLPDQTDLNLTGGSGGTLNITNSVYLESQGSLYDASAGNVDITGVVSGTAASGSGASSATFSSLILSTPGLTGYYPLNDAPGSTTVADESSNDYAGTVETSGLTFGEPGAYPAFGPAADDNGNGYINVNNAANLGLDSSNWTVLAWVYATGTDEAIVGMLNTGGGTNNDLQLIIRSDELYFGEFGDDSNTTTLIPTGQWNFVAFTYSGGTQTIYMNGVQVNQSTGHTNLTSSETITIGGSDEANTLTGAIQDTAFFNSTLSAQQISALYAAGGLGLPNTLAVTGSGTLTLAKPNTYSGPTIVEAGTLQVTGSIASSSGVATIKGAVLSGTGGTSGVAGSGTVSAGSSTNPTGTLTVGSADFSSGGNVTASLAGATGSVTAADLNVTGALTLGGTSTLTLNLANLTGDTSAPITIITAGSITGQFSAINYVNNPDNDQFTVNYTSTSVTVTLVPVTAAPFSVGTVTVTSTGVELLFNEAVKPNSTVLYSSPGDTTLGSANIIVSGPNGDVRGSLVFDPTNPELATFVPTSGLLPAGTYTVTIGGNVTSASGQALSTAFTQTATIGAVATPVLSVPSFARGPGQSVALTDTLGNTTGIPLDISNATDVTAVSFTLTYDPTLLTIASTGALTLSSLATAAGINTISYSISSVDAHHDVLTVTLSSAGTGSGLTTTIAETLVTISASVPDSAPYIDKGLLSLGNVTVNNASAAGTTGVDVAAYLGDVLGTGIPNATDASLVDQVGSGAGTGFSVFQDLDPSIIGGVGGGLFLNANDASLIDEAASGATVAQIPSIPIGVSLTMGGPDPYLYLSAVQGAPGQTVTETLYLDVTDPNGIQLTALDEAIGFDAGALQISDVRGTSALMALGSYDTAATVDNGSGVFLVAQAFMGTGLPPVIPYGTDIPVLQFNVTLNADMGVGSATGLTLLQYGTVNNMTQYTAVSDNEGALTWTPGKAPSNSGNAAVDGSVTVVPAQASAAAEVLASTAEGSVVEAPKVVEPVRRVSPVKVSNPSAAPTVATSTGITPSSELIATANVTGELMATSVGTLQPSPLASMLPEANPATIPTTASPALASGIVETATLVSSAARTADAGASLSVSVLSTNKVSPAAAPESASVKTSTSVLDEMYRQLGATLTAPAENDYNLLLTGGSDSLEDSDDMWMFDEF